MRVNGGPDMLSRGGQQVMDTLEVGVESHSGDGRPWRGRLKRLPCRR